MTNDDDTPSRRQLRSLASSLDGAADGTKHGDDDTRSGSAKQARQHMHVIPKRGRQLLKEGSDIDPNLKMNRTELAAALLGFLGLHETDTVTLKSAVEGATYATDNIVIITFHISSPSRERVEGCVATLNDANLDDLSSALGLRVTSTPTVLLLLPPSSPPSPPGSLVAGGVDDGGNGKGGGGGGADSAGSLSGGGSDGRNETRTLGLGSTTRLVLTIVAATLGGFMVLGCCVLAYRRYGMAQPGGRHPVPVEYTFVASNSASVKPSDAHDASMTIEQRRASFAELGVLSNI